MENTSNQQRVTERASYRGRLSIIIPVLHERAGINATLEQLRRQTHISRCQIIVVDGDPDGSTLAVVESPGVMGMVSRPGRSVQMNAGARAATGDILLFLHADTRLPADALVKIEDLLSDPTIVAGAFSLGIDSPRWVLKVIAFRANMRSRSNRIPYGDQAIFIRKTYFDRIGGYAEIPLMEEIDLMRRIKRDRQRIHIFKDRVLTSPRRWEAEGPLYTTFRNQLLVLLYYLGVSPDRLASFYRSHR